MARNRVQFQKGLSEARRNHTSTGFDVGCSVFSPTLTVGSCHTVLG